MSTKFVTNLDLNQNQLLNGQFESLASDPAGGNFEGRLIYNSTEKVLKVYTGSAWRKALHAASSSTTALVVSESNGTVSFSISDADGANSGLQSTTHYTQATGATDANTASAVVKRDASGDFSAGTVTASITGNVTGNLTGQVSTLSNHDTDDVAEGASNLYYTDARVQANRLDEMAAPTASVSANSQLITNVADPVSTTDAANKGYVDDRAAGLDPKESVRLATTAALTLSTGVENGDTVDGVALSTGDRVLVKDQGTAAENGIYIVAASGAPARAGDFDSASEITAGAFFFVEEGTANSSRGYVLQAKSGGGAFVVDTDALNFSQFSGAGQITAGDGLAQSGDTLSVNVDSTTIEINADTLRIAASAAGSGLSGGGASALAVSVASAGGIEVASDAVQIKVDSGVSGIATTGSGLALVSALAGTGLTFTSGVLSTDATDVAASGSGGITGTLPIASGGTGTTTSAGARGNSYLASGDSSSGSRTTTNPVLGRVVAQSVGDASATSFNVTHGLGTRDVSVQVFDTASYDTVIADVVRTDTDSCTVSFATAPASSAYRVVVTG
jgi:hypothetical protein